MQFDLVDFNRVRLTRGKEAARVRCYDDMSNVTELLWMSEKDIKENVLEWGPHLGLVLAAKSYGIHPSVVISWFRETGKPFLVKQDPQRDRNGYWTHPDLLAGDEQPDEMYEAWLKLLGFNNKVSWMSSDPDADEVQARYDKGDNDVLAWQPKPPDGDGWWLASIHDTENGIVALWLRDACGGAAND